MILFFTECEGRVYDAFRVQPYRFIPVKSAEKMLPEAMESALKLLQNQNVFYYIVENQKGLERIPVKKIAYIWRKEKYAYIEKTTGGHAAVRKPLKQIYGELPEGRFLWIDRGCICNVEQIAMVTGEEVHLFCGARIFISRDRSAQIRRILKTIDG